MAVANIQPPPPRAGARVVEPDAKGHLKFSQVWSGWMRRVYDQLNGAGAGVFSGTVALAKLTTGGTAGSLTVVNGVVTAYVAPT